MYGFETLNSGCAMRDNVDGLDYRNGCVACK